MEHPGREPSLEHSTIHAPGYFGGGVGAPYSTSGDFAASFQTYAAEWNSDDTTFSVDGNVFLTVTEANLEATRGPWVFDHPFFVIFDNAVGGEWPGPPDAARPSSRSAWRSTTCGSTSSRSAPTPLSRKAGT